MHDEGLQSLLAELFQAHGFDVTVDAALEGRSGSFYTAPVLAERNDYAVLIERVGAHEMVHAGQVNELANVVEDIGAEQGLLVHLGTVSSDAAGAGAGRVVLWNTDRLAALVGNARLHAAVGVPLERLPLEATAPSLAEAPIETVVPAAFDSAFDGAFSMFDAPESTSEPAEDLVAEAPVFDGIDLDSLDSMGTTAAPTAAPIHPTTEFPVMPARLTADDAAQRVRDRLYLVERHQLVLQPVHVLDYECDLLVEGSLRYDTVSGRIEVHGTRKDVREVDPAVMDPRLAGAPSIDTFQERTLRVSHDRAMELARNAITAEHTRVVEIETTDADEDVCMTERKQVAPRPDHIRLIHLGTVHRPQWQLRGPNGALLVDAMTGEALAEELRSADPGVVILD